MAQSSANREPTMEEILASIRRIIESNDTSQPTEAAAEPDADIDAEIEAELEAEIDTDSILDDLRASNDDEADAFDIDALDMPVAASGGGGAVRPVSLADVAARVRSSGSAAVLSKGAPAAVSSLPARGSAAARYEPDFDVAESEAADSGEVRTAPSVLEAAKERQRDDVDFDLDALSADLGQSEPPPLPDYPEQMTPRTSPRQDASTVRRETDAPAREDPRPEKAKETETGNHLISPGAGAKVAAAFDDLNEMVADGPRRSFDEIAEEMLRPMLQQWLDDNLPTLVERLVREEIERVARGGGRR